MDVPGDEEVLPRDYGKYRLTRRIATGGMAEIFLAHRHDAPLEPLVIKRILPHLVQSDGFVSMFLDEARIAAGLQHPNIVRIQDIGQVEGTYFLAMEYVHGEDIRCIYNKAYKLQRSLPLSHSIQVVADAARGLAHAHRATDLAGRPMNLVHRDVSPQNILVTYDGHVKVVDFGIAKAAGKVAQTRAGVLKGKYSYMSPEQALGEAIDHRTDLFALGIILYETTTGTRLFKRSNELATLQAIIKCQFERPTRALPGYPPELERIVLSALAKDPEKRFQDGDVFADDLERFLENSGLRTERETISAFMKDLFRDKLEQEEGSGEPAVPDPDLVREELAASAKEPRPPQARVGTELATRRRAAVPNPGFADPDEGDLDATRAERSGEIASFAPQGSNDAGPEEPHRDRRQDSDDAATIALVPTFDSPEDPLVENEPNIQDQPEPASSGVRSGKFLEPTERIRNREASRTDERLPREPWPKPPAIVPEETGSRRIFIFAAVVVVLLGIAIGLGVVLLRRSSEVAGPVLAARVTRADVRLITEPQAEVYIDGEAVGFADSDGRAGPYALDPGSHIIRVVVAEHRFERQRAIEVEQGRTYETEIRARRGFLKIRVAPWARVNINGKPMGLTPMPPVSLYEGVHRIDLVNPDLKVQKSISARVLAGQEQVVNVVLNGETADP